jgi:hypothetical protein
VCGVRAWEWGERERGVRGKAGRRCERTTDLSLRPRRVGFSGEGKKSKVVFARGKREKKKTVRVLECAKCWRAWRVRCVFFLPAAAVKAFG